MSSSRSAVNWKIEFELNNTKHITLLRIKRMSSVQAIQRITNVDSFHRFIEPDLQPVLSIRHCSCLSSFAFFLHFIIGLLRRHFLMHISMESQHIICSIEAKDRNKCYGFFQFFFSLSVSLSFFCVSCQVDTKVPLDKIFYNFEQCALSTYFTMEITMFVESMGNSP